VVEFASCGVTQFVLVVQ